MRVYTNTQVRDFISRPLAGASRAPGEAVDSPRISVVIPSYNQARFLERTLLSILNQSYPNREILVIDGGSTDGSVEIIRKYASALHFWRSEKDQGQADAIRKGFRHASGEILAWLNSDDLYLPDTLEIAAASFRRGKIDVLYGNSYIIDTEDTILREGRLTPFTRWSYLYGGFALYQPSTFWRREIFEAVGGIDTRYQFSMDTDLFVRFVRAGARFAYCREFLACFRLHPMSKTSTLAGVGDRETGEARACLPVAYTSSHARLVRAHGKALRGLQYLLQGDAGWLLKTAWSRRAAGAFSSLRPQF